MRFRLLTSALLTIAISGGILAQRQQTQPSAGQRAPVTPAQIEQKAQWIKDLSNWGRWGKDDELGALNLITPAKRQQALALAKSGTVVSLTRSVPLSERIDSITAEGRPGTIPFYEIRFRRYPPDSTVAAGYSFDMQQFAYHGQVYTHIDALCHVSYEGKVYNGYPQEQTVDVNKGCLKEGIQGLRDGIVTRGVLIDFPRLRGVSSLPPTERLRPEDAEAWEKIAHVNVSAGDAVFLYTGWKEGMKGQSANYDPSMVTFLKARDVALLGADRVSGDHELSVTALGVNLIDNADLSRLAETAARLKRWEFLLIVSPIPTPGATGSLVNPLAIF